MLRALQTSGKAGRVTFVGFDTSEGLVAGLRKGEIDGLVAQDPFDIGYLGVKTAVAVIHGEVVKRRLPTRLTVVTPENIEDASIHELLEPELARWLE